MRVLITGASGFLGSAIAREARHREHTVRGVSRRPAPDLSDWYQADILDDGAVRRAMEGIDAVIHAAGLAHQFGGKADRSEFERINVEGARVVAQQAVRARVTQFVHVSSVAAYGAGAYGESKLAGEDAVRESLRGSSTRFAILRMATVYGAGDPGNVARLIRLIQRRRFAWIGSGENRKSLIHVADAARASLRALELDNGAFDVSDKPVSMTDVVSTIHGALGIREPRMHLPAAPFRAARTVSAILPVTRVRQAAASLETWLRDDVYDSSRFELTTGFRCEVPWPSGLLEEVRWILEHESAAPPVA